MCLNEARGQARLNVIGRQENMCGGASDSDSSGRHDGSIIREEKGKTKERHRWSFTMRQE